MKRPSFFEGVVIALAAALAVSVAHTVLTPLFGSEWVDRLVVAGLGLGYILYLLRRAQERVGRITTLIGWLIVAGLAGLFAPNWWLYLITHLGMIWLIRSLYHQPGALAAFADLALNAVACMAGAWALLHSGSLFLGVWSFFLVQALFVVIPSGIGTAKPLDSTSAQRTDPFEQAHRNAETALRKLSGAL